MSETKETPCTWPSFKETLRVDLEKDVSRAKALVPAGDYASIPLRFWGFVKNTNAVPIVQMYAHWQGENKYRFLLHTGVNAEDVDQPFLTPFCETYDAAWDAFLVLFDSIAPCIICGHVEDCFTTIDSINGPRCTQCRLYKEILPHLPKRRRPTPPLFKCSMCYQEDISTWKRAELTCAAKDKGEHGDLCLQCFKKSSM